jgi:hypothetical protein
MNDLELALRKLIDAADALDLDEPRPKDADAREAWLQAADDFRSEVERARAVLTTHNEVKT